VIESIEIRQCKLQGIEIVRVSPFGTNPNERLAAKELITIAAVR